MGGQVLFQDALAARLQLIKPSRADVDACLKKHPLKLTEGIRKVVEILHARGTPVYLVSGGFRQVKMSYLVGKNDIL
jgi:phosphoserine phosphatase